MENISAKIVIQAYHEGDALSRMLIEEVSYALIVGVTNLVNVFNPSKIILGGGIFKGLPELVERIDNGVRRRALGAASAPLQIVHAYLHSDAGVVGAAAYALKEGKK